MSARLAARLQQCRDAKRTAFVSFITAGYPTMDSTIPMLLALQEGGADIIEVGIPFSDPLADGATIQAANVTSLAGGMTLPKAIQIVADARAQGLHVPVIMMGYLNPLLAYGVEKLAKDTSAAGVDGFIVVDMPGEQAKSMIAAFTANNLSFIPLITPATTDDRIAKVVKLGSGFVYCVSVNGTTGARGQVAANISTYLARVRKHTTLPIMVGFGVSKREHVLEVGKDADGVVVGSAIVKAALKTGADSSPQQCAANVKALVQELTGGTVLAPTAGASVESAQVPVASTKDFDGDSDEYNFGKFGGRYIPETLAGAFEDLWQVWKEAREDPEYLAELVRLRKEFVGGPTPVSYCKRLSEHLGGGQIWLKREDLAHTGAHKINNALGQALLAVRLGKKRIIAETGAGQHGVATATACALLGLECIVYMGAKDAKRQALNVFRMNTLGAKVVAVQIGSKTLKDAINEAMRDWVTNVETTHYIVGSAIGPHPFPVLVRDLQSVIGKEARAQFLEMTGKLPDVITACVGGGSNAIGLFHPFVNDKSVKMVGVEAGGVNGVAGGTGNHSATLTNGVPGVLHGTMTYLLQDDDGQIAPTHSLSAGLDYPGVGPEHAHYKDSGRAEYVAVTNDEAMEGFRLLCTMEGVIPALETSHSIAYAIQWARTAKPDQTILINVSGRGDKDMISVAKKVGFDIGECPICERSTPATAAAEAAAAAKANSGGSCCAKKSSSSGGSCAVPKKASSSPPPPPTPTAAPNTGGVYLSAALGGAAVALGIWFLKGTK